MGGIEGLAIKEDKVATCSSDNSVNLIYIWFWYCIIYKITFFLKWIN